MFLTETEYRLYTGDTDTAWATVGTTIGAQALVQGVERQVAKYIGTFLEATARTEDHLLMPDARFRVGLLQEVRWPLMLDKTWLDDSAAITITLIHQNYCTTSEPETSVSAIVLDAKTSRINVIRGFCGLCGCLDARRLKARVTYTAGPPDEIDDDIEVKRLMCILAWHHRTELVTEPDDQPYGSPFTSKRVTDISRSWVAPEKRTEYFGFSQLGLDLEHVLGPYRLVRSRRFQ
jgi:hypothetical protein